LFRLTVEFALEKVKSSLNARGDALNLQSAAEARTLMEACRRIS